MPANTKEVKQRLSTIKNTKKISYFRSFVAKNGEGGRYSVKPKKKFRAFAVSCLLGRILYQYSNIANDFIYYKLLAI